MRRIFLFYFLVGCVFFTAMGCAAVHRSIDNYQACKDDVVCLQKMKEVKDSTYVVSKSAASTIPLPSAPEAIAWVVSNIAAFAYGAHKGRKKG